MRSLNIGFTYPLMLPLFTPSCEYTLKLAVLYVESPVGQQQVVHRGHVGILDCKVHVEMRTLLFRQEGAIEGGFAAAHKLAVESNVRGPLHFVIRVVSQNEARIGEV